MEHITAMFGNIRERISNPLIFSYLVAWLLYNWEVAVSILWLDAKEIQVLGYPTLIDLIRSNTNQSDSYVCPLLYAIAYTIFMPFIRNVLNWFYAWATKWGNDWYFSASKDSKVATSKYIELTNLYKKRSDELEKLINEENQVNQDLANSRAEAAQMIKERASLIEVNNGLEDFYQKLYEAAFLNGLWKVSLIYPSNDRIEETVRIQNSDFKEVDEHGMDKQLGRISGFTRNVRNKTVWFVKEYYKEGKPGYPILEVKSNELTFEGSDRMHGFENRDVRISYTRISNY